VISRLRVAHVGELVPESANGVHRTIHGLLKYLPRHGIDVELWTLSIHARTPQTIHLRGMPILELPSRQRPLSLACLPKMSRVEIRARASDVDIVHFHSAFVPENVWAAKLIDVPYLITPNGAYAPEVLHGRNRFAKALWFSAMERRYLQSASAVHAVSASEMHDLQHLVDERRVFVVPNAVGEDLLVANLSSPAGRDLLFLGRLAVKQKGLDLLLRGFALSSQEHDSQLIIAGPDFRDGLRRCEQLVRSLEIEPLVSLPGPEFGLKKRKLLEDCYGLVQTSRWEGLPFSVLEALAIGRPVVITEGTNIAELVRDYKAGIVVGADPVAISRGILDLLSLSSEEHTQMCSDARRLVREHFTWERATALLAEHYRSLTTRRDARR
jgi:glycosyltransferase involved in cell wall biosynthesis